MFFKTFQNLKKKRDEEIAKKIYALPSNLKEVSGLTFDKDGNIAMVQDELGSIFIYDIKKKKITKEIKFAKKGDYEGIEYINDAFYVLRNDGTIFKVTLAGGKEVTKYKNEFLSGKNDTEGLAYSKKHNGLLILCKESAGNDLGKNSKAIYLFSLDSYTFSSEPVITLKLKTFLEDKKARELFKPSGLTVTKDEKIIVIDSKSTMMITMNYNGTVIKSKKLKNLPQPEGICISEDGDLWLSSEGTSVGLLKRENSNFYEK